MSYRKHLRNLFVVWLLTGLWHGANWTFVFWGLGYFLLLCLEHYGKLGQGWPAPLQWAYTFLMVDLLWVVFRSDTLGYAGGFLLTMLGLSGTGTTDPAAGLYLRENFWPLLAAVVFATPFALWLRRKLDSLHTKRDLSLVWDVSYALGLVCVGVVAVCFLVKGTYNPFIYFRF